jgi:hypothetical protein
MRLSKFLFEDLPKAEKESKMKEFELLAEIS